MAVIHLSLDIITIDLESSSVTAHIRITIELVLAYAFELWQRKDKTCQSLHEHVLF